MQTLAEQQREIDNMPKLRITQEKAFFYLLWRAYKAGNYEYIPAWKFVGEIYIEEMGKWFFMSYKCPSNGANTYLNNPDLIERRMTRGRTCAKYYEYRIAPNPSVDKIKDQALLEFYKQIKKDYDRIQRSKQQSGAGTTNNTIPGETS